VIAIVVTSIIIGGLIALEVIYLRAVKTENKTKSDIIVQNRTLLLEEQVSGMKSQLSKLELAIGYKSLKNQ
jgi:hypothetical protein